MNRERRLFALWRYVMFFLLICFVVTSSFLLFFHFMQVDAEAVRAAAPLVFGNILLLSLICCLMEWLLHRFTVAIPIRRIREAASRISSGDFTARIDTTQFTALSEDFTGIAEELNRMASALAETETLRVDFVSNVSHEMKTPLAVIRNYAAMLRKGGLSEKEKTECVEGIDITVQRMSELITNILKLNKLEHQQIQASPVSFDLSEQVTECILGFDDAFTEKMIELETDLEEQVIVRADPELLALVWNNLLSNAVKFTGEGGTITVNVSTDGNDAVVSVRDTGAGMDEKTGKHIFDQFYQGDTSHATEGNGLGLALVRRVIDLTGGEISVESELGKGSTFTVRLGRNVL